MITILLMLMVTSLVYAQTSPKKIGQTQLPDGRWIDVFDNGTWKKSSNFGTFTDSRDGKVYKTVIIGKQVWMAENLNYVTGNSWCYDNSTANCNKYGRLYDWRTALTACPPGWHLPSDAEWTVLTNYLGGESVSGGKMKSTTGWNAPNTGATNSSGFSGLPGGLRSSNGDFYGVGSLGFWWSSTELGTTNAWDRSLNCINGDVIRYYGSKTDGLSCRCLRD